MEKTVNKSLEIMGYTTLLPIQEKVIPLLRNKNNVVVESYTGSGKTASFGIPICENINWDIKYPQAIILEPTRELAKQVSEEISYIGKIKKLHVVDIVGKENMEYQKEQLKNKTHIIVATPGRLMDHIMQDNIHLEYISYVIIDEADYMMDLGFKEQLETIISSIHQSVCYGFFSATYPLKIKSWVNQYCKDYIFIKEEGNANINHYYSYHSLIDILKSIPKESTILFVNEKDSIYKVKKYLKSYNIHCCVLHGSMPQKQRNEAINDYKNGKYKILIASDVASRGLDIDQVETVIHVHIPNDKDKYVHRSGRSGRKDKIGTSILMLNKEYEDGSNLISDYSMQEYECKDNGLEGWNESIIKETKEDSWKPVITKLYLNAGKDKKIRAGDIIGSFLSVDGINKEDIGVIEVLHAMSFIEIYNQKEDILIEAFKNKKIKNKKVKLEIAKE